MSFFLAFDLNVKNILSLTVSYSKMVISNNNNNHKYLYGANLHGDMIKFAQWHSTNVYYIFFIQRNAFFNRVIFKSLLAGIIGDVLFVADADHNRVYLSELLENVLVPLPFSNIKSPTGIAFDPFEDRVYWTDSTLGIVYRSTIDGKNQEIIRSGVTKPMGMDLDLVAGNVYWINSGDRTIEVSKLNGDYWKVLVSDLASSPVDITLDTTKG